MLSELMTNARNCICTGNQEYIHIIELGMHRIHNHVPGLRLLTEIPVLCGKELINYKITLFSYSKADIE